MCTTGNKMICQYALFSDDYEKLQMLGGIQDLSFSHDGKNLAMIDEKNIHFYEFDGEDLEKVNEPVSLDQVFETEYKDDLIELDFSGRISNLTFFKIKNLKVNFI